MDDKSKARRYCEKLGSMDTEELKEEFAHGENTISLVEIIRKRVLFRYNRILDELMKRKDEGR